MAKQNTSADAPSHTRGTRKGEEQSHRGRSNGGAPRRLRTSRDSTSINADKRAPIDPRMPDMPPA